MAHKITLPLNGDWEIEEEVIVEEGEEVTSWYASAADSSDRKINHASIELYVGNTPEGSDAKQECVNSYMEAIGLDEGEEDIPVAELPFCGGNGWYYDAEDEEHCPVILICVEVRPGTLLMAILAQKDEESLDELMSYVDENLKID